MNQLLAKHWHRRDPFCALLVSSLLLTGCLLLGTRYEGNDDLAVIALLKGLYGLAPGMDGIFISLPLGALLSALYRFFPEWPWFSLLLYAGLFSACFLASLTVLVTVRGVLVKIVGLLLVAGFIALVALSVSFTAVSMLLWVAGSVWLLHGVHGRAVRGPFALLAAVMLGCAYLLRPGLLPLQLVLASPLLLALLMDGQRRAALLALGPLLGAIVLSYGCVVLFGSGAEDRAYREFNRTRAEFTDTARSSPTGRTPQALKAVAWTPADHLVARNWWLHDGEVFSTGNIRQFLDVNADPAAFFDVRQWSEELAKYYHVYLLLLGWVLLLNIGSFSADREHLTGAFYYAIPVLAVLVLMGVRFPTRVAVPCLLALCLWAAVLFRSGAVKASWRRYTGNVLVLPLLVAGVWFVAAEVRGSARNIAATVANKHDIAHSLVQVFAATGPETVVVDLNPALLPMHYLPFQESDPALRVPILPGGWLVDTSAYDDFLRRAGLGDRTTVVVRMIDNPKVLLRFFDSSYLRFDQYVRGVFLTHLRQRYGIFAPGRTIDVEIVRDDRLGSDGLIYLRLVTRPL